MFPNESKPVLGRLAELFLYSLSENFASDLKNRRIPNFLWIVRKDNHRVYHFQNSMLSWSKLIKESKFIATWGTCGTKDCIELEINCETDIDVAEIFINHSYTKFSTCICHTIQTILHHVAMEGERNNKRCKPHYFFSYLLSVWM